MKSTGQRLQSKVDWYNKQISDELNEYPDGPSASRLEDLRFWRDTYWRRSERWYAAKEIRELNFSLATARELQDD